MNLEQATAERPQAREAQKALAHEVTTWVHGTEEAARVEAATAALWGRGDLQELDAATLNAATADLPTAQLRLGESTIVDLLVETGLEKGRSAARRTIAAGGASINNVKVVEEDTVIGQEHLLAGGLVLVRKGRRNLAAAKVSA